jgi:hypothetical protein
VHIEAYTALYRFAINATAKADQAWFSLRTRVPPLSSLTSSLTTSAASSAHCLCHTQIWGPQKTLWRCSVRASTSYQPNNHEPHGLWQTFGSGSLSSFTRLSAWTRYEELCTSWDLTSTPEIWLNCLRTFASFQTSSAAMCRVLQSLYKAIIAREQSLWLRLGSDRYVKVSHNVRHYPPSCSLVPINCMLTTRHA